MKTGLNRIAGPVNWTPRRARIAACALAMGALAGCASATSTTPVNITQSYDRAYVSDMAARGGMPLILKGDPFPGNNAPFTQQVATALTQSHFGPAFTVFADPAAAPKGSAKTVLVVNPEGPVNWQNACRAEVTGTPVGDGGPLDFTIAFCSGNRALSSMGGRIASVTGPDDPQVAALFSSVGLELYPQRNTDRNDREVIVN